MGSGRVRLERRTFNRKNPGFETLIISFTPHYHGSLSCINEYLAKDRGG